MTEEGKEKVGGTGEENSSDCKVMKMAQASSSIFTAWALGLLCAVCLVNGQNVQVFSMESEDNLGDEPVEVTLNLQQSLSTIGAHFVGVTIDTSMVRDNWETLDFSSNKVQNLARGLVPTYFRLGGTQADCMTFDTGATTVGKYKPDLSNFTMSAKQWVDLNTFLQAVGWDFIMDLNAIIRRPDGSWDPANARKLLQFSAARNYRIVGLELGNEYDLYKGTFNRTVTPQQLAADVVTLQKLLAEFPQYYSSFIVGPETAGNSPEYFKGFLSAGGGNVVRASSYHHYYFNGNTAKLEQFTNIKVLESLQHDLEFGLNESHAVNPQLPVWLSETSSAYDGGAPNISDRFVAGFLWLDKLGLCANWGVETVIRQDFYGINYALIDDQLNPNPDYWLTLLFKRLVRGRVFRVSGRQDIRLYAACTNTDVFSAGALTVYFLNLNDYSVTFDFPQFKGQKLLLYILTPGDGDGLLSKFSALNGVKIEMSGDYLPPLPPKMQDAGPVVAPSYSFGFIVLPYVHLELCLM